MNAGEFYSGTLNASTYDLGIGRFGAGTLDDVDFYKTLAETAGSDVLELACGTGRVVIPLAEAGFRVTGLDRSPGMLAQAAKIGRLPPALQAAIRLVPGDLAEFALGEIFDVVLIPARSFMFLLTIDEQLACLARVHSHLRPGGVTAIDIFDPLLDLCVPGRKPGRTETGDDPETGHSIRVDVLFRENDAVAQTVRDVWRFSEIASSGEILRVEEEELVLRWTYRYEMRHLLELAGFSGALAGFSGADEYSDFAGLPPAYGREQVWVARRPQA